MDVNDSNQVKHYAEAERLLKAADEVTRRLDGLLPGNPERERLETRLTSLSQRALARAFLAGIRLPDRTSEDMEIEQARRARIAKASQPPARGIVTN